MLKWVLGSVALLAFGWVVWELVLAPDRRQPPPPGGPGTTPRELASTPHLTVWWDELGPTARRRSRPTGPAHNIHPTDYAGPDTCKNCHPNQHQSWSIHPHRSMNALAGADTVLGDFSGASINYRGGTAVFEKRDGAYFMRLAKGDLTRTYRINQTIGARAFQYYVGKQVAGPEPTDHHFYHKDHVLPFGYWLAKKEWVPVVHIGPGAGRRAADPYRPPDSGIYYAEYARAATPATPLCSATAGPPAAPGCEHARSSSTGRSAAT